MRHSKQARNISVLVRPLSTRSVLLSALLGTHPPALAVNRLVRIGELFGIAEGTVRVALSRMSAAGEVHTEGYVYALTDRLVARQRRQDASRWPKTTSWDGDWLMLAVTAPRRERAEREEFRSGMATVRFAELREGLWLRPDNLQDRYSEVNEGCLLFTGRPTDDAATLAARLWDLDEWAARARALQTVMSDSLAIADAFAVSAAVLRLLLADPVLPAQLLPADWPGPDLRSRYAEFDGSFRQKLNDHLDAID